MGGFACSSWYFLRFASPQHEGFAFDPVEVKRWLPVDLYVGGAEHATAHLLYACFWTHVLADAGLIDFREPFPVLRSQGVVHAADGKRMAKSRPESVVTPDDVVARHGVDALRSRVLFLRAVRGGHHLGRRRDQWSGAMDGASAGDRRKPSTGWDCSATVR